jgi:hypothetical protein
LSARISLSTGSGTVTGAAAAKDVPINARLPAMDNMEKLTLGVMAIPPED